MSLRRRISRRLFEERPGLGILPLGFEVVGEAVVAGGDQWVVLGAKSTEALQHLFEERLGLGVLPLGVEVHPQIVIGDDGIDVIVGHESAADLQRLFEERLGPGHTCLAR